jgi:PAS domain S-box-containing protein
MSSDLINSVAKTKNRWLIFSVGILLLIISTLVVFSFFKTEKNRRIVSPLKTSVHHLQLQTAEVHRWIEKLLESQLQGDIDYVWFQLKLSIDNFREMLEGNDDNLAVTIPDKLNNELKIHLEGIDSAFGEYKTAVTWLLELEVKVGSRPPGGHDYEHFYAAIIARLDDMERLTDLFLQKDLLFFRNLMVGAILACILLAAMVATTFQRFLKQKANDYSALDASHKKLVDEIKERNLAEEAMQQSNALFRTVFETSPDAVIITRIEDSVIIDVNTGFTVDTGYDRGEVIGRSVFDIDIWKDLDQRKALLDEVFENGFADNWEAVFRTKTGGFVTCLLSTKQIDINGEPHLLTVARDITDRKLYEERILAANNFLMIGNRHTEMRPLLREFVAEIIRVSGCSAAAVRILDKDGRIPYAMADGFASDFCSLNEPLSVHSNKGMCARVISNQVDPLASFFTRYGSYYVNSTTRFLAAASEVQKRFMRNTCHRFGYETLALIPIRSGDRTLGLIHIADREANRLTEDAIAILESAALQLGTAIERVHAEQALKESHEELEKKVDQRTKMLLQAKDELLLDIDERKKNEQELLGYQQRLRHLSSELLQTEERERRRIATEIHDRIGQTLAVTKIQLGALQAEFNSQDLKKKIEDIRGLLSQTIRDTRTLTFELSPPVLYELGLHAALEWLADTVRKQSGLKVEVAGDGSDQKLDAEKRVLLFRTCRELLFNVVKHAGGKSARVSLQGDGAVIIIKISDDGTGFDPFLLQAGYDPLEHGFGLFSIREQLQHRGGTFDVDSALGRGSTVTIVMPLSMTTEPVEEVSS